MNTNKNAIATTITLPVIKQMAKKLQKELNDHKLSQCQEIMAHLFDFESFNHLSAFFTAESKGKELDDKIQAFMNAFWDEIGSNYVNGFAIDEDDRKDCPYNFMLFGKQSDTWFENMSELNQEAFSILVDFFKTKCITMQYMLSNFDEVIDVIQQWATKQNIMSFMSQFFSSKHKSFYKNGVLITWVEYKEDRDYPYSYMLNFEGSDIDFLTEEECLLDAYNSLTAQISEFFDIPAIDYKYTKWDVEGLLSRTLRAMSNNLM